ncbi:alpha/beta hydrolase [Agromyces sp. G08B096]|uniref:Alpha/beta hydrolase n=1 Tax=Agromyces sp. G08B096 TaxID=3156399 RepID=A0AAU7W8C8_9MICO
MSPHRRTGVGGPTDPVLDRRPILSARARRWTLATLIVAFVAVAVTTVLTSTAWPSALLIRAVFTKGGAETVAEMQPYVPETGVDSRLDVAKGEAGGPGTGLDVFTPSDSEGPNPTVVWVHGGAWISGSKENVAPYLQILAGHGYTAIGLDYTIAPEATYPTATKQLNDSLAYLVEHADELGVDPDQIVLAGDSAGAQLASQLAVLTTNPKYAGILGVEPALDADQLVGVILNCGVYDLRAMAELNGIGAWGFQVALWAYTGTKNWSSDYAGSTMSTIDFVTEEFPPTFITGGNGDALTWIQSIPMSGALQDAGVDTTELFWAADHEPALPHEYQFHLDFDEAHVALEQTLDFLAKHTDAG